MCNKTGEATNINNEILQRQRLRQKHLIGITGDTFTADINTTLTVLVITC